MDKRCWKALVLGIVMILFCGCGIDPTKTVLEEEVTEKVGRADLPGTENTVEEKDTGKSIEKTTETVETEDSFSIQVMDGFSDTRYTEKGDKIIYDFISQDVKAELSQFPATAKTIEQFFQDKNMEIYRSIDADYYYGDGEIQMSYHMNIEPQRMDERVISFLYGGDFYYGSGTIYNNTFFEGVVFDTVTGKRLGLEDVVQDVDEFARFVEAYIATYIFNSDEILNSFGIKSKWSYTQLPDFDCDIRKNNWFFTDEGMMAICNPSEKWALSLTQTNILIPYEKLVKYLKPDFIPDGIEQEKQESTSIDIDLYNTLYRGITIDDLTQESGLNAVFSGEVYEAKTYEVDDGKIYFVEGYPNNITGIEMNQNIDGVSIAGCKIGMTYDECVERLQQYGFKEMQKNVSSRKEMLNDAKWEYIDFILINNIVVNIQYGAFESEEDYNWNFYYE